MPPLSFCLAPAYKSALDPVKMQQFSAHCPEDEYANGSRPLRECFETRAFSLQELALTTFR